MSEVVLDASAVLALLVGEPGWEAVAGVVSGATISAVNLSEVIAKLVERKMPELAIRTALAGLGLQVSPFSEEDAYLTGLLRQPTRALGLGLGDRACLALGRRLGAAVLTTDRTWLELGLGVEVRLVRG
jgi:PIN domain nuclease of toxin-antitoxin system